MDQYPLVFFDGHGAVAVLASRREGSHGTPTADGEVGAGSFGLLGVRWPRRSLKRRRSLS
eukprot:scaffold495_cov243-Pinguiococcus_pyrenoidosus.AAC.28